MLTQCWISSLQQVEPVLDKYSNSFIAVTGSMPFDCVGGSGVSTFYPSAFNWNFTCSVLRTFWRSCIFSHLHFSTRSCPYTMIRWRRVWGEILFQSFNSLFEEGDVMRMPSTYTKHRTGFLGGLKLVNNASSWMLLLNWCFSRSQKFVIPHSWRLLKVIQCFNNQALEVPIWYPSGCLM